MPDYKHGTYGEIVNSVDGAAVQSGTVAVYVGCAPVNLIRGGSKYVNTPIKLSSMEDVYRYFGYSDSWADFDLCEAFSQHFKNADGNVGPIVAINVLNPDTHRFSDSMTTSVNFVNGRAIIGGDMIILDTIVVEGMVEGVDYTVSYDFDHCNAVITCTGDAPAEPVEVTYNEVDSSAVKASDIIGGVTEGGVYTGLGCIDLIYQELNLIPGLILCPLWSENPEVYKAMIAAGTKINGHWDAVVYADIPIDGEGGSAIDTIGKAIEWKEANGYDSERSKVFWPRCMRYGDGVIHTAVAAAWRTVATDAGNAGVPMESPSNKPVNVVSQFFGINSTNRGFDVQGANTLNANGITTVVFWGGRYVLWGPHTAAYKHGAANDDRVIFDSSMRMLFHVSNSFQKDWAVAIDQPMTRALADTIKAREQEKMDALAAMGAFVGSPVVEFRESANSSGDILEGNFTWHSQGTPTPPFKSGTLKVAYSPDGFNSYFGEVL